MWNLIKGSIRLQATIDIFDLLDVTPVDYVARAIVELSLGEAWPEQAFQFSSPRRMPWDEVFDVIRAMGYPVRRFTHEEWRREFRRVLDEGADNAMAPFVPLFEAPVAAEGAAAGAGERRPIQARFDDRKTLAALSSSSIRCPPIDAHG